MIEQLSRPEVQAFLAAHEKADPSAVAMMKNLPEELSEEITPSLLASQLKARQKAKSKLPSWYARDGIVFPHGVALEQCSSETTALWKAARFNGHNFADLTGGTGVDSWAFSQVFKEGVLVEPDEERLRLAKHNFGALGVTKIEAVHATAEDFLSSYNGTFNLIYLDPDRRSGDRKAADLSDSQPDVTQLMPRLLERAEQVLVKASPMLDIPQGINELNGVQEVIVLAVNNEVKEVLFLCSGKTPFLKTTAVNLLNAGEDIFSLMPEQEKSTVVDYSVPLDYIYEPNAAIMKAGAFKSVAFRHGLKKLHANTHLYTSGEMLHDFPGRIFRVIEIISFSSKTLKSSLLPFSKAHVMTRNFPLPAQGLQKKLKLQEGEEGYVIGTTTLSDKKVLMVAQRVK